MATRLVGASASTAPARVARTTTATTPTQPSVWDSQDRAPTPSLGEVGPRAAAAKDMRLVCFAYLGMHESCGMSVCGVLVHTSPRYFASGKGTCSANSKTFKAVSRSNRDPSRVCMNGSDGMSKATVVSHERWKEGFLKYELRPASAHNVIFSCMPLPIRARERWARWTGGTLCQACCKLFDASTSTNKTTVHLMIS